MMRSILSASFVTLVATSVQAMTPAPMPRPDGMITRVAFGCGLGQTMINGQCVARTDIRQARRAARREGYGVGGRLYVAPVATAVGVAAGLGAGLLGAGPLGLGQAYYTEPHYSPYEDYTTNSSDWYAVRAYYAGGPWYYGSNGWGDYAARAGIACTPGSIINGADGIRYVCQ